MEGITHSICGMEWRHHRELYEWFITELGIRAPRQIEYPRMRLGHTVTSKRLLVPLVERGYVAGWDDPRLPTIRALRRRGVPAEAIRDFATRISVVDNKTEVPVEMSFFEHCIREHLNRSSPRRMGVLDPLRLVIEDEPEGEREVEAENNPEDPASGARRIPFSRELWIEREDFMVEPSPGFRRLVLGGSIRLRFAGEITCRKAIVDTSGKVVELRCTHDGTGAPSPAGGARRAIIHWVSAPHAVSAEVRLYGPLFSRENPLEGEEGDGWLRHVDPDSLRVVRDCRVEPALASMPAGYRCQLERQGYFCVDPDSGTGRLVLNRIVPLKDRWKAPQAARARSFTSTASRSMDSAARAAPVPNAAAAPKAL
jgi:glutaminyl-tRNA synthetase